MEIPLRWDADSQTYVEDYGSVIEKPIYSPSGHPILLTIEDACPHADMADGDPAAIDCGSCRHYRQFPGSLLGVCGNEQRRRQEDHRAKGESNARREGGETSCEI